MGKAWSSDAGRPTGPSSSPVGRCARIHRSAGSVRLGARHTGRDRRLWKLYGCRFPVHENGDRASAARYVDHAPGDLLGRQRPRHDDDERRREWVVGHATRLHPDVRWLGRHDRRRQQHQVLVSFALVNQVPVQGQFATGVNVFMSATDSSGGTAIEPIDAVGNYFAFNAAFPFTGAGWLSVHQHDLQRYRGRET